MKLNENDSGFLDVLKISGYTATCLVLLGFAIGMYGQCERNKDGRFLVRNVLTSELERRADRNLNGRLEFDEKTEAWNRMGIYGSFVDAKGDTLFPEPSLKDLVDGVKAYRGLQRNY
ncbi:MAG TPA: hypothetical protein VJH95_01845 [Candidatus Nanoarchaeia archaeon]|nr:hypothetical protein [Candidatus Nanoarchaeia archaeon]